jgi:hypothetical protein
LINLSKIQENPIASLIEIREKLTLNGFLIIDGLYGTKIQKI